jgi:WD40 repeat protein
MPVHNMVATLIHTVSSHTGDVNSVAFSSDHLATCSGDKTVRLWSLDTWSEHPSSPLCGHKYAVHCCTFSPNKNILATCSTDGKVIFWDTKTGESRGVIEHKSKSSIRVCRFTLDATGFATGSDDETLCLWDVATNKLIRSLEGHESSVIAIAYSPDNAFIISGSNKGDLRMWDARYGHSKCLKFILDAHDLGVTCCEFSPSYGSADSGTIDTTSASQVHFLFASCGFDNDIKLWDVLTYSGSANVKLELRDTLKGHEAPVMVICFNPSGNLIASGAGDKTVRLWDPLQGEPIHVIEGHSRYVTSCAFSLDGVLLATGSNDKMVKIWKVVSDSELDSVVKYEEILVDLSDPAAPPPRKAMAAMQVEDICQWLMELGMSKYVENFRRNAIDGDEISSLTHDTLEKDLGVGALGHRNKILRAIENFNKHPVVQTTRLDDGVPDEYLCPITREKMRDPVIASDGYTYERAAIKAWMSNGKTRSPMTNAVLGNDSLTPNRSLKMLIVRHMSMDC